MENRSGSSGEGSLPAISPRSLHKKEDHPRFELTFSPDRAPATWSLLQGAWRERKAAGFASCPTLARRKQPYPTNPGFSFLEGEISRDPRITMRGRLGSPGGVCFHRLGGDLVVGRGGTCWPRPPDCARCQNGGA